MSDALESLQKRIGPTRTILKAGRSLLHEGMLFEYVPESKLPYAVNVRESFLCSDVLILLKMEGRNQMTVVEIPLTGGTILRDCYAGDAPTPPFSFSLVLAAASIEGSAGGSGSNSNSAGSAVAGASLPAFTTLVAPTASDKAAWMDAISQALTHLLPHDAQMEVGWYHMHVRQGTLFTAAIEGDAARIRAMLTPSGGGGGASAAADAEALPDPNTADEEMGATPLHYAARGGRLEACQALLEAGAALSLPDASDFNTPLHAAALRGEADVCALLREHGAPRDARNLLDDTPLLAVLRQGPVTGGGGGGGGGGAENSLKSAANTLSRVVTALTVGAPPSNCVREGDRAGLEPLHYALRLPSACMGNAAAAAAAAAASSSAPGGASLIPAIRTLSTLAASLLEALVAAGGDANAPFELAEGGEVITPLLFVSGMVGGGANGFLAPHHRASTEVGGGGSEVSPPPTPPPFGEPLLMRSPLLQALLSGGAQPNARSLKFGVTPLYALLKSLQTAKARQQQKAPAASPASSSSSLPSSIEVEAAHIADLMKCINILVAAGARFIDANETFEAASSSPSSASSSSSSNSSSSSSSSLPASSSSSASIPVILNATQLADALGVRGVVEGGMTSAATARAPPASAASVAPKLSRHALPLGARPDGALDEVKGGRLASLAQQQQQRGVGLGRNAGAGSGGEAWAADATIPSCRVCDVAFSLFNRRHHCRHCGLLICGACSTRKFPLCTPVVGGGGRGSSSASSASRSAAGFAIDSDDDAASPPTLQEERVCDGCFNRLSAAVGAALARAKRWEAEKAASVLAAKNFAPDGGGGGGGKAAKPSFLRAGAAALSGDAETRSALFIGGGAARNSAAAAPPSALRGQTGELKGQLSEVRDALALRGEKLVGVADASADLADKAKNFADLASKLKAQQKSSWFGF